VVLYTYYGRVYTHYWKGIHYTMGKIYTTLWGEYTLHNGEGMLWEGIHTMGRVTLHYGEGYTLHYGSTHTEVLTVNKAWKHRYNMK